MKQDIVKKAIIILGSYSGVNAHGNKVSKCENLCEEFVESSIEDTILSVKWSFALKRVDNIEGDNIEFKEVPSVSDCIKIAILVPSNLQYYSEDNKIYFKGSRVISLFYYAKKIIDNLLKNDRATWSIVPENFKLVASLNLAMQVAFAMYSDSLFADGLKKQYLIKLEQTKYTHSFNYNLTNSGETY